MGPSDAVAIYKEAGIAVLFIVMYLTTLIFFIRDLREQRVVAQATTEKMIKALESSEHTSKQAIESMEQVNSTLQLNARQTAEFIAYLEGRDDARRERGGRG
jgi:DNA-binding MarR family transcriptional regulator